MVYSIELLRETYRTWKPIFGRPQFAKIRKITKIQEIVNKHHISQRTDSRVVPVLQELLKDNVFLSEEIAQRKLFGTVEPPKSTTHPAQINTTAPVSISTQANPFLSITDAPMEELKVALTELHSNGQFSDLTITCQDRKYHVHKAILCPRSLFINSICQESFEDGEESVIDFANDDPRVVDIMVQWFYHLDYTFPKLQQEKPEISKQKGAVGHAVDQPTLPVDAAPQHERISELLLHAHVYVLAEKYKIRGLKTLALMKFKSAATPVSVEDEKWVLEFLEVTRKVFTTMDGDKGLRDVVLKTFHQWPKLLDEPEVKSLLQELRSLAYDLLMYMHQHRPRVGSTTAYHLPANMHPSHPLDSLQPQFSRSARPVTDWSSQSNVFGKGTS
ncbi:hypothetical protein BX600DRAFT_442124 [Xylariales sp. PMI_506]|nr:hypothetical protein BX600DRAFT_442124 [Xylariales sp. PMI_506]